MEPQPFQTSIPDSPIADLQTRLSLVIFPSELDDADWDYGVPLADIERLTSYWKDKPDWRKVEKHLNETLSQFTTKVTADGFETLIIHFVHQRSEITNTIPLLFIHESIQWGLYVLFLYAQKNIIEGIERSQRLEKEGSAYYMEHSIKPQIIDYALQDRPVALLVWIYEKLHDWTDDQICTWISIYWFSTAGPAANGRIYYEFTCEGSAGPIHLLISNGKIGISHFPKDVRILPRSRAHILGPIVFQNDHEHAGHFAAWERPQDLMCDLRIMFGRKGVAYDIFKGKSGYAASTQSIRRCISLPPGR